MNAVSRRVIACGFWLTVNPTFTSHVNADTFSDFSHRLSVNAGTEFDSNLAIEDEESSSESDTSLLFGADAELNARYKKDIRVNANYSLSESIHSNYNEFDLQTHVLRAGAELDKQKDTLGTHLTFIHAQVSGSNYLSIQQFSPSISRLFSTRFYSRNTLVLGKKHYSGQAFRNAYEVAATSDLYFFQKGTSLYWLGGISLKSENATANENNYKAIQLKGQWIKKIKIFNFSSTARFGLRLEDRNYEENIRDETRLRLQAKFLVHIDKQLSFAPYLEFGNYVSDIPELDYSQYLIGLSAQYML